MTKFIGVFKSCDNADQVEFVVAGDLTEDKVIAALDDIGFCINKSFYTNGELSITDNRISVEWDNGDSLDAFTE